MNVFNDTIVSRVTSEGKSSVGIIRISGKLAFEVSIKVLNRDYLPIRTACYLSFLDLSGKIIDQGIVLWFPGPSSFTGEDVLELQGHGNPIIIDLLITTILSIPGIRLANPGEFSERAFLNGKIDLAQAESISDLINATSEQAARSAMQSLQGLFSIYINNLIKDFTKFRAKIEAQINFSDHEINADNLDVFIEHEINRIISRIKKIRNTAIQGSVLREGIKVVISGAPNSGKSSLLNALSLTNRAIVTNFPGTTRDVIYENIIINGVLFILIDTAGLRITNNPIENIGIERAWNEIKLAEHILFVIDGSRSVQNQLKNYNNFIKSLSKTSCITIVFNKSDLSKFKINSDLRNLNNGVLVSSKTGVGIEALRQHLYFSFKSSFEVNNSEGVVSARRRHINILSMVLEKFLSSKKDWKKINNIELLADDLRTCQDLLGGITGKITSDELLSEIFSEFCIGK
ncbi:putative tRNA modification GTPase trmE [Buchnera aphidicola str. Bp (Baizongia pistaciae)]|uniref:tRNA modification GTPase MnmE n=1 Tax=Buchnera aphidicola subsp. Baizongia pistaciae (strain Bp) TaxID=224915 RepID=MNME_BUCBP|nr:tRNA uridine-5-carboxymethylaminomethyl(34) synthesis GTPase MnmE [Buchnera aphidicola]P59569.1 RecName: Full=tRNA modification GTPase MnmE [Buchnera aphidicola str. Bp (Baizongia pistaciae)]AAO26761.1 putative tRNA modification GTPase trmE [Buchnera aphidicola str. Bp (Baizongia pistaciae)]